MLWFWNRYEVPALQSGSVSATNPRPSGVIISGPGIEELLLSQAAAGRHPLLSSHTAADDDLVSGLPSRDSAGGLDGMDAAVLDHHRSEGVLHDLLHNHRSEYSGSPSPPSPFSLFFNANTVAAFQRPTGPYSHRYDSGNSSSQAPVPQQQRGATPLSGASSSEDLQSWLFGISRARGGRATPTSSLPAQLVLGDERDQAATTIRGKK